MGKRPEARTCFCCCCQEETGGDDGLPCVFSFSFLLESRRAPATSLGALPPFAGVVLVFCRTRRSYVDVSHAVGQSTGETASSKPARRDRQCFCLLLFWRSLSDRPSPSMATTTRLSCDSSSSSHFFLPPLRCNHPNHLAEHVRHCARRPR